MDSPLAPFKKADGSPFTSNDCINVEALGYTYGPGSLEQAPTSQAVEAVGAGSKVLVVRGLNRAHFKGSFVVTAEAEIANGDGTVSHRYFGHHSVLSRWNVDGCANCQTHLDVVGRFPLTMLSDDEVSRATFSAHVSHRDEVMPDGVALRLSVEG